MTAPTISLPALESSLENLTSSRRIPAVVLLASSTSPDFKYSFAAGPRTPEAGQDVQPDSTFVLASCTKLLTAISALQCVERGLVGLDDDLSSVLGELKGLRILKGFTSETEGGGEPIFEDVKGSVTLRYLLTHSSGFAYDMMSPLLERWRRFNGQTLGISGIPILERLTIPLLFEPGTSWAYGYGLDWTGILIKRLTGTSLGAYMKKNIFDPLEITDISFQPGSLDASKRVKMSAREGAGSVFAGTGDVAPNPAVTWTEEEAFDTKSFPEDEYGGHGCIGSAASYMKVLQSLLKPGKGVDSAARVKLLGDEMLELLFTSSLTPEAEGAYGSFVSMPFFKDTFSSVYPGSKVSYALGGAVNMDEPKLGEGRDNGGQAGYRRSKGTLTWSGMPNLLWTIDREAGLALLYASNILPFGDIESGKAQRNWEDAIYQRYEEFRKEGK